MIYQHLIETTSFELCFSDEEVALSQNNELGSFFKDRLSRIIDEVFTSFSDKNVRSDGVCTIERLELDLGIFSYIHFYEDFESRFRIKLIEAMDDHLASIKKHDNGGNALSNKTDFDKLIHFLTHGTLPWNSNNYSMMTVENIMKNVLLLHAPLLRDHLKKQSNFSHVITRLIRQLPDSVLSDAVVSMFFSTDGNSPALNKLLEKMIRERSISVDDYRGLREAVWLRLFNNLINTVSSSPTWSDFISAVDIEIDEIINSYKKNDHMTGGYSVSDMRDRLISAIKEGDGKELKLLWPVFYKSHPEFLRKVIFDYSREDRAWTDICEYLPSSMLEEISEFIAPDFYGYVSLIKTLIFMDARNSVVMKESRFWSMTITYLSNIRNGTVDKRNYLIVILDCKDVKNFIKNINIIKDRIHKLPSGSLEYGDKDRDALINIVDGIISSSYDNNPNINQIESRLISSLSGHYSDKDKKYWKFILKKYPELLVSALVKNINNHRSVKIFSRIVDGRMVIKIVDLLSPPYRNHLMLIEKNFYFLTYGASQSSREIVSYIYNEFFLFSLFVCKRRLPTLKYYIDILVNMLSAYDDRDCRALLKSSVSKIDRCFPCGSGEKDIVNACIELLENYNRTCIRPSRFSRSKNIKAFSSISPKIINSSYLTGESDDYAKNDHEIVKKYTSGHIYKNIPGPDYEGYGNAIGRSEVMTSRDLNSGVEKHSSHNQYSLTISHQYQSPIFIGYDIDDAIRHELISVNGQCQDIDISLKTENLANSNLMLFIRFYRDLQWGNINRKSLISRLSVLGLISFVRLVFLKINAVSPDDTDFMKAMEYFSRYAIDKREYYSRIIDGLMDGKVIDFEKLVAIDSVSEGRGVVVENSNKTDIDYLQYSGGDIEGSLLFEEFISFFNARNEVRTSISREVYVAEIIFNNHLGSFNKFILHRPCVIKVGAHIFRVLDGLRSLNSSLSGLRAFSYLVFLIKSPYQSSAFLQKMDRLILSIEDKKTYYINVIEYIFRNDKLVIDDIPDDFIVDDKNSDKDIYSVNGLDILSNNMESWLSYLDALINNDKEKITPGSLIEAFEGLIINNPVRLRTKLLKGIVYQGVVNLISGLLPDRILCRLLYILQRSSCESVLSYGEAMTAACYGIVNGTTSLSLRKKMWSFIFCFLFVDGNSFHKGKFIQEYFSFLRDLLDKNERLHFSSNFLQQLMLNVGSSTTSVYQDISSNVAGLSEITGESTGKLMVDYRSDNKKIEKKVCSYDGDDNGVIEDVYIGNSGQVLLAPYFPRLFEMLGLMEKSKFIDSAAAERGVHLLQYIVNESCDSPEYQLVLNKILCGVKTGVPVARSIVISDSERGIVNGLLEGVIKNWKAIGNTSISGFRESFLQREGRLHRNDKGWHLLVQSRSYDMLLDQLPWSFSLIRQPWMERVVHVEWR